MNSLMIDEAVYRTAPATPGLLKIYNRGANIFFCSNFPESNFYSETYIFFWQNFKERFKAGSMLVNRN